MKILLSITAIVAGALYLGAPITPAHAGPVTITGTYTISETYSDATNSTGGGPAITGDLGTGIVNTTTGTSGNFTLSLTAGGGYTSSVNFATFSPDNNKCEGPGCAGGSGGTETDPISVSFTFTKPSGAAAATDTASFQAKYSGAELTCSTSGFGKSDCVTWTAAGDPIVANFTDGAVLDIMLLNAQDWNITSGIKFSLIDGPSVPEPASLGLLGLGVLGTIAFARRLRV
jgi:hypothetical protein